MPSLDCRMKGDDYMPGITPAVDPNMLNTGVLVIIDANDPTKRYALPDPMEMTTVKHHVVTEESGRNELAEMVNMFVATKCDHTIAYKNIDPGTAAYIALALDSGNAADLVNGQKQFDAEVYNPSTGQKTTARYYASDVTFKYQQWIPDNAGHPNPKLFADVSFTMIEV